MRKRLLSVLLTFVVCFSSLTACGGVGGQAHNASRVVTDSLGRQVTVPEKITKVLPSGKMAQIFLLSFCPDTMVGISNEWDESALEFLPDTVKGLPVVGQLHGGKGDFNLESVLSCEPQIIVDVGETKKGMEEELDSIQEQTGVPVVHIDGSLEKQSESYRLLGDILGRVEDAELRASYLEKVQERIDGVSAGINPVNALLITGPEGLNVIAAGTTHSEAFDKFANNLAVVEEPSSKGTGNEVDMEQILKWNPDYIIYLPETTDRAVFDTDTWQEVTAVKEGNVYHVPFGPYDWLGFPASVQRCLGMMWMADTFYPEQADFDLYTEAKDYYKLFYGYDLSEEKYNELISQ